MPMIKQYKNDAIRAKQEGAQLLTRPEAEQINDRLMERLDHLPENMGRNVAEAYDRLTEAGMYSFNPLTVDCPSCGKEAYVVTDDDPNCNHCGVDLSKEVGELRSSKQPKPPETEELPAIERFEFRESGDEEVLQILAEIENFKIRCPEEWDVWNHLSNAQEILMGEEVRNK